jgi:uncharacterized protein
MRFEWDETKRISNLWKHGLDFEDVERAFENTTVTLPDNRFDTETNDLLRVISFRKATPREEKHYYENIRN